MGQVIELELTLPQLAVFVASLYKEGVCYKFESMLGGVYRFIITGY